MKKKTLIILLVALVIVAIISTKTILDRKENKSKELFEMALDTTFYDALKAYQDGTKYIVKTDDKMCDTSVKMPSSNYNYYIEFNDEGKITKYYFYNEKWIYKNDNVKQDNIDYLDHEVIIEKNTNSFKYDCPKND